MIGSKAIEPVIDLLDKALGLRSRRQEMIAGNVANLDTPNYTRKDVDFEGTLAGFLEGKGQVNLDRTDSRHLGSGWGPPGLKMTDSQEEVDIDQEMAKLTKNTLHYQATVQMLIKKLDSLRTVIEGGR